MMKSKTLINLTLVCGVWFCLAFSCNSGTRPSTSTGGATPARTTAQGGAPTEQDVKDAITRAENEWWGTRYRNVKVTFDNPVRVGASEKRSATNDTYYNAQVNWTQQHDDGIQIYVTHHKGGTVQVTQDDYSRGVWKYEGVTGDRETSEVLKK